jgi:putative membrane protein
MDGILLSWLASTVAVLVAGSLLPGVTVAGFWTAVAAALVLGFVNAFIRPVVLVLTLPLNILSLGCFTLVINALFVLLAAYLVPGFAVRSFGWALLFSLVLGMVNFLLNAARPPVRPRGRPDVVP